MALAPRLLLLAACAGICLAAVRRPPPPCTDEPPTAEFSCAQQAGWGKCNESFMAGYCFGSCGKCASPDRGPYFVLSVSALVSGIVASDFDERPFVDGVVRAAVVDAGAQGVDASRVSAVRVAPATAEQAAMLAAPPVMAEQGTPSPPTTTPSRLLLSVSYDVAFDARADADAYAAEALAATDDSLAAAANERSNMRDARAATLLAPPTLRVTPKLPSRTTT